MPPSILDQLFYQMNSMSETEMLALIREAFSRLSRQRQIEFFWQAPPYCVHERRQDELLALAREAFSHLSSEQQVEFLQSRRTDAE